MSIPLLPEHPIFQKYQKLIDLANELGIKISFNYSGNQFIYQKDFGFFAVNEHDGHSTMGHFPPATEYKIEEISNE